MGRYIHDDGTVVYDGNEETGDDELADEIPRSPRRNPDDGAATGLPCNAQLDRNE